MASLYFSDVLRKADIDPAKVKLIRHSLQIKTSKPAMMPERFMSIRAIRRWDLAKAMSIGLHL